MPSWSRRVKSLGGIAGRRPPAKPLAPSLGGESGRVKTITPAAARMARDAKTMSARRRRAGIAAKPRGPIPRPPHSHGGRGTDRLAVHVAFRLVAHHLPSCASWSSTTSPPCATRSSGAAPRRLRGRAGARTAARRSSRRPRRADAVVLDVAHARARRAGGLPAPARRRRPHARAHADRARRRRRPRRRPGRRRRRLPRQAVRARGAARRACGRCCAARRRRTSASALRFADLELDPRAHEVRRGRAPDRAHAHRVPAARAVPATTRARC